MPKYTWKFLKILRNPDILEPFRYLQRLFPISKKKNSRPDPFPREKSSTRRLSISPFLPLAEQNSPVKELRLEIKLVLRWNVR